MESPFFNQSMVTAFEILFICLNKCNYETTIFNLLAYNVIHHHFIFNSNHSFKLIRNVNQNILNKTLQNSKLLS